MAEYVNEDPFGSDEEPEQQQQQQQVGYVEITARNTPARVYYHSQVRSFLRREALGRRGQATQQVSRLQRILLGIDHLESSPILHHQLP